MLLAVKLRHFCILHCSKVAFFLWNAAMPRVQSKVIRIEQLYAVLKVREYREGGHVSR